MTDICDRAEKIEAMERQDAIDRVLNRPIEDPLLDEEGDRICRDCEEKIPQQRLLANPHAVRCVPCQSELEGN